MPYFSLFFVGSGHLKINRYSEKFKIYLVPLTGYRAALHLLYTFAEVLHSLKVSIQNALHSQHRGSYYPPQRERE